jgi:hypothetical protein
VVVTSSPLADTEDGMKLEDTPPDEWMVSELLCDTVDSPEAVEFGKSTEELGKDKLIPDDPLPVGYTVMEEVAVFIERVVTPITLELGAELDAIDCREEELVSANVAVV